MLLKIQKKISVTFVDGKSYNAEIVGTDPYADVAIIKIDVNFEKLYPLPVGDTMNLEVLRDGKIINIILTLEARPES